MIQQLLILSGRAGGGKGTVSEIIEGVLGRVNCAELRTNHLTKRFELNSYIGKMLLYGKDVDGDFLEKPGASVIKKLVGHDWVDAEHKFSNERTSIRGEFSIIINCNSRLRVRIDGDVDAWRRRLLLIEYKKAVISKVIPNFSKLLMEEEGSGILTWMIAGAIKLIQDVKTYGKIALSEAQSARVDCLLQESDGLKQFIINHIAVGEGNLTTEEIIAGYVSFCKKKGWRHLQVRVLENNIPNIVLTEFGVQKTNDIVRNSTNRRGYRNLILKEVDCENQESI
jgi:phage/plasmid-associated DNA primase